MKLFTVLGLFAAIFLGGKGNNEIQTLKPFEESEQTALNETTEETEENEEAEEAEEAEEEVPVVVEEEQEEPEYECYIVFADIKHATYEASAMYGEYKDEVILTFQADLFYKCEYVKLNGNPLSEDENITGKYLIKLQYGENLIEANFVVDEDVLGKFSQMYDELRNHDWTNLFSVTNVVTIVNWFLNGGILIAIARYFIKDKKLEKKVEDSITENINKIIPDSTKQSVVATVEKVVTPTVNEIGKHISKVEDSIQILTKCVALMQENTPASKLAILEALQGSAIVDASQVENSKEVVEDMLKKIQEVYDSTMNKLDNIAESNKEIIDNANVIEKQEEVKEENKEEDLSITVQEGSDGTRI